MGEARNVYSVMVMIPEGKRPDGRLVCTWQVTGVRLRHCGRHAERTLEEVGTAWIQLAQDEIQCVIL
jgi:hypothetical protein